MVCGGRPWSERAGIKESPKRDVGACAGTRRTDPVSPRRRLEPTSTCLTPVFSSKTRRRGRWGEGQGISPGLSPISDPEERTLRERVEDLGYSAPGSPPPDRWGDKRLEDRSAVCASAPRKREGKGWKYNRRSGRQKMEKARY